MAVVLIGSTGNGKSTLGNFLIDPSPEHAFAKAEDQKFSTARDNKPHTQEVKSEEIPHDSTGTQLTIIDTPGLNESPEKDLEHMINIIKKLQVVGKIQACLFVVKFSDKIDAQYRATVTYYSKLLPTLFESNTAIVMTNFATDTRSVKLRERQGVNVNEVKQNVVKATVSSGKLQYEPKLFAIDSQPMDETEVEESLKVRKALLDYICDQTPVNLTSVTVAKPDHIKKEDEKEIVRLHTEIKAFKEKLQEKQKSDKSVLNVVEAKGTNITEKETELESAQRELKEKDTESLINIRTWSVCEEWRYLSTIRKEFDLQTAYRIAKVKKISTGDALWSCDESDYYVRGSVSGKFRHGLDASLELQTTKKERFKLEIQALKTTARSLQVELTALKQEQDKYNGQHSDHSAEIKELQEFVEKKGKQITKLSLDRMSLDEAVEWQQKKK